MKITANPDGTYLLTPTSEEGAVVAWALANHSPVILVEVLEGWLRGEREYMRAQRGQGAIAMLKAVPPAEISGAVDGIASLTAEQKVALKASIRVLLGG